MIKIGQTVKEPRRGRNVTIIWIGSTPSGSDGIVSVVLPQNYNQETGKLAPFTKDKIYFLSEIIKHNQGL